MNSRGILARVLLAAAVVGMWTAGAAAQDEKVFKLGVVAFLSGGAAEFSSASPLGTAPGP